MYTGNGKGKTTAASGLAMRAKGQDKKVAVIFFDKGGQNYGERKILKRLHISFYVTGKNRINKRGVFRLSVTVEDKKEGINGLILFGQLLKKKMDMIILDEINSSLHLGIVSKESFFRILNEKWKNKCELVCTGRNAPKKLIDMADLVTDMKLIKHYFYKKVPARKGIEF